MATRCSRILLSFLTSVCLVAAFEIQEDCLVRNTIEVTQIIFDTLEFLSLARPEEHSLTATIFCEDISQFDYLNVTSSSVSLRRLPHDENLNSPTYSTPNTIIGWTRFRLGFMNNLSLYDSNNVSWLPGPTPLDCIISKLKIQNGNFTRQCASNTPAWLMNGSQAVDVLVDADIVSLTSGAKEKRIDLTLFSTKKYKPFFNVCGIEFQLGVREGSLVMVSGLTADPLPPGHHRLALIFLSLDQQTTFKIESEGEQLLETKLASYPSKVRIWGRKNDIFLLVQHLHTIPDVEDDQWCMSWRAAVSTLTAAVVSCLILLLLITYVTCKHGCQQANRQYHSPRPAVPVTSTPSYMEPIVPHPASKLHARPNSLDIRLETPSPEHLYEEIDLKSIKSVGEKSYANAELVNGSSDTSSSLRSATSSEDKIT